jgi:hypothetical protein
MACCLQNLTKVIKFKAVQWQKFFQESQKLWNFYRGGAKPSKMCTNVKNLENYLNTQFCEIQSERVSFDL